MSTVNWDIIVKFATLGLAAYTVFRGISEYANAQRWKQAEFLAKEYKDFISSSYVQHSFNMLDGFRLSHKVQNENGLAEIVVASPETLKASITKVKGSYPDTTAGIFLRLCLDKFLYKMGLFQSHVDNKLITAEALGHYIIYWIRLIGDKENDAMDAELRGLIHNYILDNSFGQVRKLFEKSGYLVTPDFPNT